MKTRKLLAAALALTLVLSLSAMALAEDTLKIGMIGPLSGDTADYGNACLKGAQMYVDEVNAAGGILGMQVEMTAKDSKGDPTEATLAYSSLVNEGMSALFGPVLSGESAAVAELAAKDRMPMISPSATAANVTDAGDNVFRGCFLDPFQAKMLAKYAVETKGATKVGVLYDNSNDYSIGLYENFTKTAGELGATVVDAETVKSGDADFTPQLSRMADAQPEYVLVALYYDVAALVLRQARDVGMEAEILGPDGFSDIPGQVQDDLTLLDNVVYASGFSAQDESEVTQNFIKSFTEKNGAAPGMFNALGYDTMKILLTAIQTAGSTDKEAVIAALKATNLTGVTGSITFDDHNDPIKSVYITGFENGVATTIERVDP